MLVYQGKNNLLPLAETPEIISNTALQDSIYIQLRHITFKENGKLKSWDIAKSHDSVAILLYHQERKGFIFVRQFRISVFLKNEKHGFMYELCAGLCDKDKSTAQIALEELQEECGFYIDEERLHKIGMFYSSAGMNGSRQHIFYAQVTDSDKKGEGGGNEEENENIELIFVPLNLIDEFLQDENCPKAQSLAYATLWFQKYCMSDK